MTEFSSDAAKFDSDAAKFHSATVKFSSDTKLRKMYFFFRSCKKALSNFHILLVIHTDQNLPEG